MKYLFYNTSLCKVDIGTWWNGLLCWKVIDTPGILDHPLEDRNTIEMQAITALAHLRAAVLYFMDISEQCGNSIEQQVSVQRYVVWIFYDTTLWFFLALINVQTCQLFQFTRFLTVFPPSGAGFTKSRFCIIVRNSTFLVIKWTLTSSEWAKMWSARAVGYLMTLPHNPLVGYRGDNSSLFPSLPQTQCFGLIPISECGKSDCVIVRVCRVC